MHAFLQIALSYFVFIGVHAASLPRDLERRATPLSPDEIAELVPFVQFARAAYCAPTKITGWQCGQACDALPGFNPTLTGGDGNAIQYYYVGSWPQGNAVVVAYEGTDPTKLESDLTDVTIPKGPLDPTLFPSAPSTISVHTGFRNEHAQTAAAVFAQVQQLLSDTGYSQVITVGHSLGGALALLSSLSLKLQLPSSVSVSSRTFGTPRVGDAGFASYYDSQGIDFKRINNLKDLVPILPGRFLGFVHTQGEVHILGQDDVVACDGEDNATDPQCQIMTVPNIAEGNIVDHLGPYQGIYIGTPFCT